MFSIISHQENAHQNHRVRDHVTAMRTAIIKKAMIRVDEDVSETGSLLCCWWERQMAAAAVGSALTLLKGEI